MEGSPSIDRFWCYMCSQAVITPVEPGLRCSNCDSKLVQKMSNNDARDGPIPLWSPVLLGLVDGEGEPQVPSSSQEDEDASRSGGHLLPEEEGEGDEDALLEIPIARLPLFTGSELEDDSEQDWDNSAEFISFDFYDNAANYIYDSDSDWTINPSPNPRTHAISDFFSDTNLEFLENQEQEYAAILEYCDIKSTKHLDTAKIEEELQCSICLEEFEIGEEAKETPCKHKFHEQCITCWLDLHGTCPICRFQVCLPDQSQVGIRDESHHQHHLIEWGTPRRMQHRRRGHRVF